MTTQSTIDKLIEMRLTSMSDAFRNQMEAPRMKEIPFEDRFGMLVDIEYSNRKSNSLKRLICNAGGTSYPQLEREYGVNRSTLSGWIKQLSTIKVSEDETITLKEFKALQKEMQRLKIENEILKKATAIFAKEQ